jgi:exodeoxyribonuclease VII small subunit
MAGMIIGPSGDMNAPANKDKEAIMSTAKEIAGLSFEQALAELERIVQNLESGNVELEQSITMYERGAALKAHCEGKLKDAKLKIEKIVLNADGQISVEPAKID